MKGKRVMKLARTSARHKEKENIKYRTGRGEEREDETTLNAQKPHFIKSTWLSDLTESYV